MSVRAATTGGAQTTESTVSAAEPTVTGPSGTDHKVRDDSGVVHEMRQMGAKRIGSLAIGIGVVGIVLNQMADMEIVNGSTGVIDVSNIFNTAGQGLELLVIGVIIAAAAVLLNLWSGF